MKMRFIKFCFLAVLPLAALPAHLAAQNTPPVGSFAQDTTKKLKIETAQLVEYFVKGDRTLQKLSGDVRMRQENTLIYCDSAILDEDQARLKGRVIIAQGDSVRVFADSAFYRSDTKISDLYSNVVLVNGQQQLFTSKLRYDLGNKIATYRTGATLHNGKSQLTSTYGYYHVNQKEIYFKDKVVVTDPDFTMRTDTLVFNTEEQLVRFVAPTVISQKEGKIYTESGFYDIEQQFAEFDLNPQYEKEGQQGKADKMRYNGVTKEYVLEGNAYIDEPTKGQRAAADVIRYNQETGKSLLIGNASFRDSTRNIAGAEIRYDAKNKSYQLAGRGKVIDGGNTIEADSLDFNDVLGNGAAIGNVIWRDTTSHYTILAFRMDYNKQSQYLNAFGGYGPSGSGGRPLMKTPMDSDTLYMSADTLSSWKPDTLSDTRLLSAHRDVRIFKRDMQALCDSLSFSTADSIFRFYPKGRQPLVWSDTSQFSADTIWVWMHHKKLNRIWLRSNTLVINSEDEVLFNQIKGRRNTIYLSDNKPRQMFVEGNAEAVYYALDDKKAYIGVNQTTCSEMRLFFEDNQVRDIKFYEQPSGKFSPLNKSNPKGLELEGFFWEKKRRPRRVTDLTSVLLKADQVQGQK
jgi:lipopolysaccharide export system protein LptA